MFQPINICIIPAANFPKRKTFQYTMKSTEPWAWDKSTQLSDPLPKYIYIQDTHYSITVWRFSATQKATLFSLQAFSSKALRGQMLRNMDVV